MEKSLINSRALAAITFVIGHFSVSKSALAQIFGIKPAKFSEILNERMNVGVDIMAVLCSQYGISADWLLTGEGAMLKGEREPQPVSEPPTAEPEVVAVLRQQLAEKDKQIAALISAIGSLKPA